MDTSKEYILMCEKAKEIQKLRKICKDWEKGDWFIRNKTKSICVVSIGLNFDSNIIKNVVFLPRQDQLQEMICWHGFNIGNSIKGYFFYDALDKKKVGSYYSSMEQLWLAFVMSEKYNKIWDGKSWIKKKGEEMSHSFCRRLKSNLCKENKIPQKAVGVIYDKGLDKWYVYVDPQGHIGCYRGCCKWSAMIDGIKDYIRLYQNKESEVRE